MTNAAIRAIESRTLSTLKFFINNRGKWCGSPLYRIFPLSSPHDHYTIHRYILWGFDSGSCYTIFRQIVFVASRSTISRKKTTCYTLADNSTVDVQKISRSWESNGICSSTDSNSGSLKVFWCTTWSFLIFWMAEGVRASTITRTFDTHC